MCLCFCKNAGKHSRLCLIDPTSKWIISLKNSHPPNGHPLLASANQSVCFGSCRHFGEWYVCGRLHRLRNGYGCTRGLGVGWTIITCSPQSIALTLGIVQDKRIPSNVINAAEPVHLLWVLRCAAKGAVPPQRSTWTSAGWILLFCTVCK